MNEIWIPQMPFKILRRLPPETLRFGESAVACSAVKIRALNPTSPRSPFWVPIPVAEGGVENVLILGINLGQVAD